MRSDAGDVNPELPLFRHFPLLRTGFIVANTPRAGVRQPAFWFRQVMPWLVGSRCRSGDPSAATSAKGAAGWVFPAQRKIMRGPLKNLFDTVPSPGV